MSEGKGMLNEGGLLIMWVRWEMAIVLEREVNYLAADITISALTWAGLPVLTVNAVARSSAVGGDIEG